MHHSANDDALRIIANFASDATFKNGCKNTDKPNEGLIHKDIHTKKLSSILYIQTDGLTVNMRTTADSVLQTQS
jgi:hypothetical protein